MIIINYKIIESNSNKSMLGGWGTLEEDIKE